MSFKEKREKLSWCLIGSPNHSHFCRWKKEKGQKDHVLMPSLNPEEEIKRWDLHGKLNPPPRGSQPSFLCLSSMLISRTTNNYPKIKLNPCKADVKCTIQWTVPQVCAVHIAYRCNYWKVWANLLYMLNSITKTEYSNMVSFRPSKSEVQSQVRMLGQVHC